MVHLTGAVLILLALSASTGSGVDRHCILLGDACVTHCPRNMHPYHTRCDVDTMSQRTCEDPFTYPIGYTCGWSRCDCNAELLLDEKTLTCVDFFTCTLNKKRGSGRRRKQPKLHIPQEDEFD